MYTDEILKNILSDYVDVNHCGLVYFYIIFICVSFKIMNLHLIYATFTQF